jgi:hypothetical protein
VIQDQLGHASIVLTASTYVTVVPQLAHAFAESVARLILDVGRRVPGTHRPRCRQALPEAVRTVVGQGPGPTGEDHTVRRQGLEPRTR